MKEIGYYNGQIGKLEEMRIPMLDRAMFFGDGVYDVAFAYNNRIFALEDHLDRFFNSCKLLEIAFPLSREELKTELNKCMEAAESNEGLVLYWQSTRGNCKRNHIYPAPENKPTLLIMVTALKKADFSKPMQLITLEDTRFMHCNIKTLNLIPNVVAAQRAEEAHCGEAVLHRGEILTECAHSSLLLLKDGVLMGPKLDERILPGISRKHLFALAEKLGIQTEVRDITMKEVMEADEVIVCSTTKLCKRADFIDGVQVGGKDTDLFKKLQKTYFDWVYDETGWVLG